MHLTMCTMVETKVNALDNNQNIKSSSENDQFTTPRNSLMDPINEETIDGNDSNDSDDMEDVNDDGRHSSSTFIISMDNKCGLIDIDERERLALEHCDVGDDEEDDNEINGYSSHVPIDIRQEMPGESPYSNEYFGAPVPTPIQLGISDILSDDGEQVEDIKQRKYPVLPSIGKSYEDGKEEEVEEDEDDPTINQLDYSREKMETEADFFADYRVNTSVVKPTPRNVPLPPIGQTYTPRNSTSH